MKQLRFFLVKQAARQSRKETIPSPRHVSGGAVVLNALRSRSQRTLDGVIGTTIIRVENSRI